ncbi:ankyrin repeat domain-containing protein [Methylocaldum sp.]|uniref:ankyrin repeat domain-containing protein n=1 Tax=Methylocaldum sp. TaxID=1969727 RepID=UPI002D64599A|nr:ankyrin repeat domain-containing protein [Methylocaldum sp.]HYE37801.1 ankyrin repeat domain-containing protein [Methylocaldum sp.]
MSKKALLALILLASVSTLRAEDPNQALFVAAASGQVERLDSLLAQGADANSKNGSGRTPLMGAAFSGNVRVIKKLLTFGADPNAVDNRGVTALMEAAAQGYEEAVKALIAAGADVAVKDGSGLSSTDRAKQSGHIRIAALLEQALTAKPVSESTADRDGSAAKKSDTVKK